MNCENKCRTNTLFHLGRRGEPHYLLTKEGEKVYAVQKESDV